jgi:hypothetical protein
MWLRNAPKNLRIGGLTNKFACPPLFFFGKLYFSLFWHVLFFFLMRMLTSYLNKYEMIDIDKFNNFLQKCVTLSHRIQILVFWKCRTCICIKDWNEMDLSIVIQIGPAIPHSYLTQLLKTFRYWLRIRGDIRNRNIPQLPVSMELDNLIYNPFFKPFNNKP